MAFKIAAETKKMEKMTRRNGKTCGWFNRRRMLIMFISVNIVLAVITIMTWVHSSTTYEFAMD